MRGLHNFDLRRSGGRSSVRAGAVVAARKIAVEAEHLVPGRKEGARNVAVHALSSSQLVVRPPTIFEMIQRQESRIVLVAAGAT
jgi:hypothetical protein